MPVKSAGPRILSLCALILLSSCTDPVSSTITASVMKQKVSEIISEARAAASSLIAEGGNQGNALLVNAGNELNVQADNTARIMGERVDKTVDQIGSRYQPVVASLLDLVQQREQLKDEAYKFKDSAVVDLHTVIATWPVVGNTFLVKRISGTSLVFKPEADYTVSIQGIGLGIQSARLKSITTLSINGVPTKLIPNSTDDQTATFTIPNGRLHDQFLDHDMHVIPAEFDVSQEIHPWYGFGTSHNAYKVPIKIVLVPHQAATVNVVRHFDEYVWTKVRTETRDVASGDHNCPHCDNPPHAPYQTEIHVTNSHKTTPMPHDLQLRNPLMVCIAGACPWSSVMSVVLQDNFSQIVGNISVWGSPVAYRLTADVYEYLPTGNRASDEVPYKADFDLPLEFKVPKAPGLSTIVYYRMFTKEKDFLVPGQNHEAFQLESKTPTDEYDLFVYRLKRPQD